MKCEHIGDTDVVVLPERLGGPHVKELTEVFSQKSTELSAGLTIDFCDCQFIDSSGIGTLVSIAKQLKSAGQELTLKNIPPDIQDLFSDTGLDMVFNIETDQGLDKAKIDIFQDSVDIRLEIEQEMRTDVCVFHLSGVMNHPMGSRYFKQQFLLAMATSTKILLDFENLTFFDSLSVSVILNMFKLLKETGGSLRICAANYIVEDLFSTLNIEQIIPVFTDIEKALLEWD